MNNLIQPDIYTFGAGFILEQVAQFEAEIDGTLFSNDIEYVHRMRVASRRMHTGLRLFNKFLPENYGEKWLGEMKGITRALGNARDLDVQIQFLQLECQGDLSERYKPGYEHLLLRLTQLRANTQQEVNSTIHTLQRNQIFEEILDVLKGARIEDNDFYSPSLYELAQRAINKALTVFLSYHDIIQDPNNSEKLHQMRIAGKRLRYTMEIFRPLYREAIDPLIDVMKGIQDQLGDIHDCDVWIAWLSEFIRQEQSRIMANSSETRSLEKILPGIRHLIEDRTQNRCTEYGAFIANWQGLVREQTWVKLRQIIQATGAEFEL